jgi:hypothetical protein
MYRGRSPFEGLPGFKSLANGNKSRKTKNMGSFPNMMNFLNFRNLTKWKVPENRYFPFHEILEAT